MEFSKICVCWCFIKMVCASNSTATPLFLQAIQQQLNLRTLHFVSVQHLNSRVQMKAVSTMPIMKFTHKKRRQIKVPVCMDLLSSV